MGTTQPVISCDSSFSMAEAVRALQWKLDEAIDDMEQGRVQTIEDAWEEIDAI